MEHSIVVLVALVLLIVFAGFQFQKVWDLFRTKSVEQSTPALKMVVKAKTASEPKVKMGELKKETTKKASGKKKVEMPIKKKTTKKK